jgi:hypothetical protein
VDVPSPFTRVQQRVLAVTVVALSALGAAAALVVGVLSRSYVWGLATALGSSAATAAILLPLTLKWRDTNAATGSAGPTSCACGAQKPQITFV